MGKYFKYWILLSLGCLLLLTGKAQDTAELETDRLRELIAEIAERTENESVTEELANSIYDLAQNPINPNTATRETLESLFWLKNYQIDQILAYISQNGTLKTIYEIAYIPSFSAEDVQLLKHFVVIENVVPKDSVVNYKKRKTIKQQFLLRSQRVIEQQDGFRQKEEYTPSNHYLGNPWKYYIKYNISSSDKITAGVTGEKDAGEDFFSGSNQKGFDFYSFHFRINNYKFIKTAIIGDYSLQFGQGLVMNSRYSFGKSLSVFNSTTTSAGINRYTSSDENNFFRGMATTLNWENVDMSLFYSKHSIDANIQSIDSTAISNSEVSSLQTSGIHGTPSEIFDEKSVQQETVGTHLRFLFTNIEFGTTALHTNLSEPLNPDPDLYNIFTFKGKQNTNFGIDYRWRIKNFLFFGEQAISHNGGIAILNGLQYFAGGRFGLRVIHRHYEKNYQSLYSNAFGENTRNQNEDGLFAGIECSPAKNITLAGFVDFFKFPWLRYQTDMPSMGREYMLQLTYKPNKQFNCYVQYRNKEKEENLSGIEDNKNLITSVKTERIRCNTSYRINNYLNMQNRIELNYYKKEYSDKSYGVYISQDLAFSFSKLPIKLYLRYAIFDIQSYDSRIYAYETDVLYTFSVPAFYDKGSRSYLMAKISPNRNIDLWLKYSVTLYTEKTTVSSNLNEIEGNKKSEIRIQMLLRL